MSSLGRIAAAAAALTLAAGAAQAQQLNTNAPGRYGQMALDAGFVPDPHRSTVGAGGAYDASRLGRGCVGYIDQRPSFTLDYRAGDWPLYISAQSDADTTLAIQGPDGAWRCDDDSGGDLDPLIGWERPRSGRYQIFVGRYGAANEMAPAYVSISELESWSEDDDDWSDWLEEDYRSGRPDFTLPPAYGSVRLFPGFRPDPHTVRIAAGGDVNARQISGCVGWIAEAPDYQVFWNGAGGLPLTFHAVSSEADLTLVINDPHGQWLCNDDADGLNPVLTLPNATAGRYDVWVGTYSSGRLANSELRVTELHRPR